MATFLDLQNNIASDLTRTDLGSQTKSAVRDAIKHYEHCRFWFNVTRSKTFPTVAGQSAYGADALADIPNALRIDHLFLTGFGGSVLELDRVEPDEFERLTGSTLGLGKPAAFTYVDAQIVLWPTPAAVYTLRPHMHYRLSTLAADGDSNAWCNEGEMLIRAHAKLILYANVIEDDESATRMQAQLPALKSNLDQETSARTSTGRIRGTSF